MMRILQTETYQKWETRLRDNRAKALIASRIFRLAHGLPGDVVSIGDGISELRIRYGPGYRIYFRQKGDAIIILLCGGNKTSQKRDIKKAILLAANLSGGDEE